MGSCRLRGGATTRRRPRGRTSLRHRDLFAFALRDWRARTLTTATTFQQWTGFWLEANASCLTPGAWWSWSVVLSHCARAGWMLLVVSVKPAPRRVGGTPGERLDSQGERYIVSPFCDA